MSVRSKDDIMKLIGARIGDEPSDDDLAMLGDISDTLCDYETRLSTTDGEWKQRFEENDAAWRKKFKDRFFSAVEQQPSRSSADRAENITIDDLFTERKV